MVVGIYKNWFKNKVVEGSIKRRMIM
jgi:hypothetical protein